MWEENDKIGEKEYKGMWSHDCLEGSLLIIPTFIIMLTLTSHLEKGVNKIECIVHL